MAMGQHVTQEDAPGTYDEGGGDGTVGTDADAAGAEAEAESDWAVLLKLSR
jgi:hypothetical protein